MPDLCKSNAAGKFNYALCDKASDFYDLYVYQTIDLGNGGRVDTTGNLNIQIITNLNIYKLFMRSSRSMPFLDIPYNRNPSTGEI